MAARVLGVGLSGLLAWSLACGGREDQQPRQPAGRAEAPAGESARGEAPGEEVLVLDPSQLAGIETAPAEAAEAPEELPAMGRVLDPLPLIQAQGAATTAEAALRAAERELDRVRELARDGENASTRDLEAVQVAAAGARAAWAEALARAASEWGSRSAEDRALWAEKLAAGRACIARLELAPGSILQAPPSAVLVSAPGYGMDERSALPLGAAGQMDPTLQGPAWLVALEPDPPPPGAALSGRFELAGTAIRGVWLPESAVLWHEGAAQAWVARDEASFELRALALARPLRGGWLASAGVAAGERVVTAGAQQLLAARALEGARAGPEE